MSLIPPSELRAAFHRIQQAQAAKEPAPMPTRPRFRYTPRTEAQWRARCDQTGQPAKKPCSRTAAEWDRRAALAKQIVESTPPTQSPASTGTAKVKVTQATVCVCGHRHSQHCTGDPRLHSPEGTGAGSYCLFEHCTGQKWNGTEMEPCDCMAFRVTASDVPKLKHPKCDDWTLCKRCGHRKAHHCKRNADGLVVDGTPYQCTHVPSDGSHYKCTSTRCAEPNESGEFCSCPKFVNPFLVRKAKAAKPHKAQTAIDAGGTATKAGWPDVGEFPGRETFSGAKRRRATMTDEGTPESGGKMVIENLN
jgi:hypothetical protein